MSIDISAYIFNLHQNKLNAEDILRKLRNVLGIYSKFQWEGE